jgi:nitronate monooxygenase
MKCVDDFRLRLGKHELVPIMIGGMGVDISTADLALEAARLGGVGHISDAMVKTVSDRRYDTKFVKDKLKQYKYNVANTDKSDGQVRPRRYRPKPPVCTSKARWIAQARQRADLHQLHGKADHERAQGDAEVRLSSALDAGIDGITLAAGLHLGSFAPDRGSPALPRRQIGHHRLVAARLQLFLRKNARTGRLPDYIVVEGPLAGGHLGFGMDWMQIRPGDHRAEILRT